VKYSKKYGNFLTSDSIGLGLLQLLSYEGSLDQLASTQMADFSLGVSH
jgi:hypothetical protein